MARRRRKKHNILSIIGKVIILCLVVIVGYLTYTNYGNEVSNRINNKKTKSNITEKNKDKTDNKKETQETTAEKKEEEKTTSEGKKEYNYENQEGEKVTIKADKSVEATGFAGASNHKFYLRGTTLYYQNISSDDKEVILAYNVEDLLLENKEVTAILAKDGKIVKENNYITYKNK